jgi:hypothetical protein
MLQMLSREFPLGTDSPFAELWQETGPLSSRSTALKRRRREWKEGDNRLFATVIHNDSLVSPRLVIRVYALTRNREG